MSQIEPQEKLDYDDVFESISNDALRRGLSNDQVWKIWQTGLAAQQSPQADGTAQAHSECKTFVKGKYGYECEVCGKPAPKQTPP